jgi:putative oxidoreductase
MKISKWMVTDNDTTTILIRLMIGVVFLSEGIQKFLFAETLGLGRFEKIGLPFPDFLGIFVGFFEILCAILILIGLYTRIASFTIIIIMLVAIATTKSEILAKAGFWEMMHGSRTDWAMSIGAFFLLIKGGGERSFDKKITRNEEKRKP